MKTLLILALLCSSLFGRAAEREPTFSAQLRPLQESIVAGTVPRFELKVTNVSKRAYRVMRLDKREDWQQVFAHLTVTQMGKEVQISATIWDPAFDVPDADLTAFAPGGSMIILLKKFAQHLEELEPGDYKAFVSYRPAYHGAGGLVIRSNEVPLRVVPKPEPIQSAQTTPGLRPSVSDL